METTKECLMCSGETNIRIADYVNHRVVWDRTIKCPVCEGTGFTALGERRLLATVASVSTRRKQDWITRSPNTEGQS